MSFQPAAFGAIIAVALTVMFASPAAATHTDLAGKQLLPREIAAQSWTYWRNYELTKADATALAESAGTLGAWHDNLDENGTVASRDCGLYQINLPASQIGGSAEAALRTTSSDPATYTPVWQENVRQAYRLYTHPWVGRPTRLWQPWVAYTTGWAIFPGWWVWHQNADGVPVGPWLPTGRYIQRAIAGQMNAHIVIFREWTPAQALYYARRYAAHFAVADTLYVSPAGLIAWHLPAKPTVPPADGVGPRPIPNDGT